MENLWQCNIYHILFYPIKFFFIIYYIIHLADDLSNATLIAFKVYIWSVHAFPENWTTDLGVGNIILYCLSYYFILFYSIALNWLSIALN